MQEYLGSRPQLPEEYGNRSIGGQARTFVDRLKADTGVPRDCLPAATDERVGWRMRVGERERERERGRGGGGSTEVDLVVVIVENLQSDVHI